MQNNLIYVVHHRVAVSTAISIIQIKAGSTKGLNIIRAAVTQGGSTTSAVNEIMLVRKSSAATVTTYTPLKINTTDPAADAVGGTSATGITATAEGTDGDVMVRDGFNVLNGWLYLPVPEERIYVPPAGIIALKFVSAPANLTYSAYVMFQER